MQIYDEIFLYIMANFALVSLQNDHKAELNEGKVSIGRGPLLKITDKRVSRNHATIEVDNGSLSILPVHINPTFYQASGTTKFEALKKDCSHELCDGDSISFLPNDLIFKVCRRKSKKSDNSTKDISDGNSYETSKGNAEDENDEMLVEMKPETSSDLMDQNMLLPSNTDVTKQSRLSPVCNIEDFTMSIPPRVEVTLSPLKKTRVLPSWMVQGKTMKKEANVKVMKQSVSAETSSKRENKDKICVKETKANGDIDESEVKDEISLEENKKRKHDEDVMENCSKRKKKLPHCPYGNHCYRKNPVHFQEYSHSPNNSGTESGDECDDDLPECPYGEYCYRQNGKHRTEYKHTPGIKTKERKAKKKVTGKIRDDDEDGPNDYDYSDSFIDDDKSSNNQGETSEDSDWVPSEREDNDDDITQLLTDARNFTNNKKMLKPM